MLFSDRSDHWVASAAAGEGALFRYISRPWDADELLPAVRQAAERFEEQAGQPHIQASDRNSDREARRVRFALRPGDRLGQYRLLERLGQGGMGVVFKAVHVLLQRVVALKALPAERLLDPRAVARFRSEMRAAGRPCHPNIVQTYDARTVRGVPFLVMEFIDGLDLARLVRLGGRLPVPDACELARQTAAGLQHAYEHGLVHRDLKPANLMLTSAGHVKILDLGLALWYGEASRVQGVVSNVIVGTADYMAPEQALGDGPVDTRADLYSLGCTLYELLAGRPPFGDPKHETVLEKLRAHAREDVPPLSRLRRGVPAGVARLLGRLLAKNPTERFDSPAEVAAALSPFAPKADLKRLLTGLKLAAGSSDARELAAQATVDYSPE